MQTAHCADLERKVNRNLTPESDVRNLTSGAAAIRIDVRRRGDPH